MVVAEKCTVTWLWRMCCNFWGKHYAIILTNDNDILLCVSNMHESLLCMLTPLPFVRSFFVGYITVCNCCLCLVVAEKLHMVVAEK